MSARRLRTDEPQREAGDLLAVEAIDRSGVVITREGAFVRILEVTPPNPFVLSANDRARVANGFCYLIGRLRPGQSVQFYVDARPFNLDDVLARSRQEVSAWAGPPPTAASDAVDGNALSRWRLYAAMEESLRLHADDQAAMRTTAYIVLSYQQRHAGPSDLREELRRTMGRRSTLLTGLLERDLRTHRRLLRESLAHTDAIRIELDALSLPSRLLNGEQIATLLWSRFNPTSADLGRHPRPLDAEILGQLDTRTDAAEAREAAARLRGLIARSSLDFKRSRHTVDVERDIEQTIYASTTAEHTHMGVLVDAMMTRQPFTMSVHVHALDRSAERRKLKRGYRRLYVTNRTTEAKGQVPDFDRYAQEHEAEALLSEMSISDTASLYQVSVYQSIRARGPEPDTAALAEAVEFCADRIETAMDCRVQRGEFQQRELWESTLPLGRDIARRVRKYASRNVGDLIPLIGTACGSLTGVPFAFSEPGRTLELLNPYDPAHANQVLLISGRSGSGKTMCANVIVSRCVAHGARAFVIDRAGHYTVLSGVIDGAREVEIGADSSKYAINPWDVEDPTNPSREKIAFLVSLHAVMMGDEGLTTLARAQLGASIRAVYAGAAAEGTRPRESMLRKELLQRATLERSAGSTEIAAVLRQLAEQLSEFCDDGAYAYLLDRETNVPADAPLIVFETRRCPEGVLKPVMFSIVEYVTRAVEAHRLGARRLASGPQPPLFTGKSILLIDEAWAFVGNPQTGMYANDLARRARHLGLFLIVMSQHLSDFETEHGLALLRNASMQMLLSQPPEELPFLQDALRLSSEEAAMLGRLRTVKGVFSQIFWINGARGRGQVALRVGPTEYWFCTSDPIRDAPLRDRAIADHSGDVWAGIRALADGMIAEGVEG
jgi:TraG P-loop domain